MASHPATAPVRETPGLIAFWDFQDDSLRSAGPVSVCLRAEGQPPEPVADGVFGPRSLRFRADGTQAAGYLRATASDAPALNISGPGAGLTVVAWIKREASAYTGCEFIAGVWNEHHRRQYGLFLNLGIWDSRQQVGAHVSSHGGPTPGHPYCMDVAIGATPVTLGEWHAVAMSYDGVHARAYLDGRLDMREPQGAPGRNPFHYPGGLSESEADFTVGAVTRPANVARIGENVFQETGSIIANPFVGLLGGLAVWSRALDEEEILLLTAQRSNPL